MSNFSVENPATCETIAQAPRMGATETAACIEAAEKAFPSWAARTAQDRAQILKRWFDLVLAARDELSALITREAGKPLSEALGEVNYGASFIEWFAEEARRVYGETIPAPQPGQRLFVFRQPVGVVAAVTPWNFPLAMVTRKVAPALAAGCAVILKPAAETPLTAMRLAELAWQAGVPRSCFLVVTTDDPAPVSDVLMADPRVRKLTFTGSTAVGKLLMAACAQTVKKVSLELGGNAPFLVFDDADIEAAVDALILAKFRNAGQTCVCVNRVYVHSGIYDAFSKAVSRKAAALRVGDGASDATQIGPLISRSAIDKVKTHVEDACAKGAQLLLGGEALNGPGYFFPPTVLRDVPEDAMIAQEETFGPVIALFRFDSEAEAIARANDTSAGLAAYAFTRDLDRAFRVMERLEYGMVGVNEGLISTEVAPFGGIKESGLGREGSRHGIENYLEMKFVCLRVGE